MKAHVTTKEEILEKALKIAMEEGIDKVSIRKLASACNMAVGSMYNYYPDKGALINAVSERFWGEILEDQEKLYRSGISFTIFLEQYFMLLYGRLSGYDSSWLKSMNLQMQREVERFFKKVLSEDERIDRSIWNMELNPEAFCEYVLSNIIALLIAGENNCRFFVYLLEHLLYDV